MVGLLKNLGGDIVTDSQFIASWKFGALLADVPKAALTIHHAESFEVRQGPSQRCTWARRRIPVVFDTSISVVGTGRFCAGQVQSRRQKLLQVSPAPRKRHVWRAHALSRRVKEILETATPQDILRLKIAAVRGAEA
jgi:hypothetical protein